MSKLTYDKKIELYNDRIKGLSLKSLSNKYGIRKSNIQYICNLIDKHGIDILRAIKNKEHLKYEKEEAINRILINGEAIWAVVIDMGLLSYWILQSWIKKYKENGYNIVERKRGRNPTVMKKLKEIKKNETLEEENERLKQENLYLKSELEYV